MYALATQREHLKIALCLKWEKMWNFQLLRKGHWEVWKIAWEPRGLQFPGNTEVAREGLLFCLALMLDFWKTQNTFNRLLNFNYVGRTL